MAHRSRRLQTRDAPKVSNRFKITRKRGTPPESRGRGLFLSPKHLGVSHSHFHSQMATRYRYYIQYNVLMPPRVGGVATSLDTVRGRACHVSLEKKMNKGMPLVVATSASGRVLVGQIGQTARRVPSGARVSRCRGEATAPRGGQSCGQSCGRVPRVSIMRPRGGMALEV